MKSNELTSKEIVEVSFMKKEPKRVFYRGNKEILKRRKVSIVGTRRPTNYTKEFTFKLAKELSKRGFAVVSGSAMGVDAIAHRGAGADNTIAVMGNGLDIKYPAVNRELIGEIEDRGLTLSLFEDGFRARNWSFVVRNELVVALGEFLIVTEADLNSGSLRSVEFALKMGKSIYTLPHRLNESRGTNKLLKDGLAKAIYDIDEFVNRFGEVKGSSDPVMEYLNSSPTLDDAVVKLGDRVYELELEGVIEIENGSIRVVV
jgi:DNA processing protein